MIRVKWRILRKGKTYYVQRQYLGIFWVTKLEAYSEYAAERMLRRLVEQEQATIRSTPRYSEVIREETHTYD